MSDKKVDLGRRIKPLETFMRVLLFAMAGLSILITLGIIIILVTDSGHFFTDMARYKKNQVQTMADIRVFYDGDLVPLNELQVFHKGTPLDPASMDLATLEPEVILGERDHQIGEIKFDYSLTSYLSKLEDEDLQRVLDQQSELQLELRQLLASETYSQEAESELRNNIRLLGEVIRNDFDLNPQETQGETFTILGNHLEFSFWGKERSNALIKVELRHEEPGITDYILSVFEFLTGTKWQPMIGNFGILPLLNSTLLTSLIAMLVAAPLGLFVAIYLSEYASEKVRGTLKPILEILAGIPTVVYGYFAVTFMTPLLQGIFGIEVVDFYNTASAGIVMGILILPLVASMAEDAISAVPRSLREASFGLGATKLETSLSIVVPAAFSGLAAAFIVGLSRAIGETMIVALAAGAGPNLTMNPFEGAETMTGYIVRISGGDISYNSIDYNSIFSIGLVLFLTTLVLNMISRKIVSKFRETYE